MDKSKKNQTYIVLKRITLILLISQLLVKIYVEFGKAGEVVSFLPIKETTWAMAAAWLILIPLCIQNYRKAFFWTFIFGIINAVLPPIVPILGICHHYFAGIAVGTQGLIISIFSFMSYKKFPADDFQK